MDGELLQKAEARGYVANGELTQKGYRALEMKRDGFLDASLEPTQKGVAYVTPYRQALEDPDLYRIRKLNGWDAPEGGFMTRVGKGVEMTVDSLGSAIKGAAKDIADSNFLSPVALYRLFDPTDAQAVRRGEQVRSASNASNFWVSGAGDLLAKPFRSEDEEIEAERIRRLAEAEMAEMELGAAVDEILGPVSVAAGIATSLQEAEANLTDEEREQLKVEGQALGEFTNPGDLLLDLATAKVASTLAKPLKTVVTGTSPRRTQAALRHGMTLNKSLTDKALLTRKAELAASQLEKARRLGDGTLAARMERILAESQEGVAQLDRVIADSSEAFNRLSRDGAVRRGLDKVAETTKKATAGTLAPVGRSLEGVGRFLQAADNKLKGYAAAALGEGAGGTLATAKGVAMASPLIAPAVAPVAGTVALLSSGRLMESIGRFTRIMGEETLKARGTLSYWQNVANAAGSMPHVAHLIDFPARVVGKGARIARGAAAGGAFNAGIESVFSGGTDRLPESFGSGLVFGAVGSLHGAFAGGKRAEFQAARVADMANLRETFDAPQKAHFDSMPRAEREALGTYSAIFPSLNIHMKDSGPSFYDPATNTVGINVRSKNKLKPLIGHEVTHYLAEMGLTDTVINRLVGAPDLGVPGMFRAADGSLDPHFKSFLDGYNARMRRANKPPIDIETAALEYFSEIGSEYLTRGLDSGRLQARARQTAVSRLFESMLDEVVRTTPVVNRFARNTGTLFDANGSPLVGTGLVRDGVRVDPMSVRMLDDLMKRQAGRPSVETPGVRDKAARITPDEYLGNKALTDQMDATFKTDAAGNVVYGKDGKPEMMSKAELAEMQAAGAEILKVMRDKMEKDPDFLLPEGHVEFGPDGGAWGTFFMPEFIQGLADKGILNAKQIAALKAINNMLRRGKGERISTIYQKALMTSTVTGKKRYKPFAAEFREIAPYMVEVTKDGNIVFKAIDARKLADNVRRFAKTAAGKRYYNGDVGKIHADIAVYLDNHKRGIDNKAAFGEGKRDFLNSIFGMMRKDQADHNPAFARIPNPERDAVIRSFRLDRMNSTMRSGNGGPLPLTYDSMVRNLLPEPASQSLNPFFLPEPVWHGTPHKVDRFSLDAVGTGKGAQAYGWGL